MDYTITNDSLDAVISQSGCQLLSIRSKDGTEYLWQRDAKYWNESSPMIFPFVARLVDKTYYMDGEEHHMNNHGFARNIEFKAKRIANDEMTFTLKSDETTYKQYPRDFTFSVNYKLEKNKLFIKYIVRNDDKRVMHFGLGGHPGFNVPLNPRLAFEDYYIQYEKEDLTKILFTPDCFVCGEEAYHLEGGKLPLRHELFDDDAIVVKGCHKVTLKTDKDRKQVTVEYPDMEYFGIWHRVKTDAPYVCLEPWLSLPADKEGKTVFEEKKDMIHLNPGDVYTNTYSMEII